MPKISEEQFTSADGVAGWVTREGTASATFDTGSFAKGVEFVAAIGDLAEHLNHHPDVELSYPSVAVHLTTHDVGGLSDLDVRFAREISETAAALGFAIADE